MRQVRQFSILCVVVACAAGWTLFAQADESERADRAAKVFDEIMSAPDKAIPSSVLEKAEAVAVFPGTIKGGIGIGAQRGKGILSAKNHQSAGWSNPAFLTLTGGSIGAQIGAQEIDLVLVVMNRSGLENLLRNEFTLGGEASVAAGPIGRGAEALTDIQMRAEILSYSRSRGLFAGITLAGSAVREDEDANKRFYGRDVRNHDLVLGATKPVGTSGSQAAAAISAWHAALAKYVK